MAADAGAKDVVLGIEAEVWKQLGPVSKALQSQILGDASGGRSLPSGGGLIAGVPLFLAFVFLGKKFLEMQARDGEKKDKKKEEAAKEEAAKEEAAKAKAAEEKAKATKAEADAARAKA